MAALDFPASPTNGQVYTSNGSSWTYDSAKVAWRSSPYEPGAAITSATAPTSPQNGDIWFDTDDGTTYVYYNDGTSSQWTEIRSEIATSQVGLVPIVPTSVAVGSGTGSVNSLGLMTFTGASSVSLNGVFTSAYKNYKITFEAPTVNATTAFNTRFRTAGTDNTVAYYAQYWVMSRITGTVQANNGGSATSAGFGTSIALTNRFCSMSGDIINPFETKTTQMYGQGAFYDATSSYQNNFSILYDNAVSFDGITIFLTSATMTGSIQIYGYND